MGVNLDEWNFMYILTLWLSAAVSRAWQPGFTHCGCVCCEKESPLPSHVHHSSISFGAPAMVRSLFPSLWLSNGPLFPSCHHERWHYLHSVLLFFLAHPFNRQGNPNWDLYPGWFIWCMVLHRVSLSLYSTLFLSYSLSFRILDSYLNRAALFASLCACLWLPFSTLHLTTGRILLEYDKPLLTELISITKDFALWS